MTAMRMCLLIMAGLLPTAALADQIKLKNGDTLTGSIVKKDGDKLTLKSEFLAKSPFRGPL